MGIVFIKAEGSDRQGSHNFLSSSGAFFFSLQQSNVLTTLKDESEGQK